MALGVPPQSHLALQTFVELHEEQVQAFLDALRKAGPKFNTYDLASYASSRTGVPRRVAEGVVETLAALYKAKEHQTLSLEAFVDEQVGPSLKNSLVAQAVAKADKFAAQAETESRWSRFRQFLMVALTLDDTVGTAAKAGPVMTDHEQLFVDARVLTDVRPIFHPDLSEKPHAVVLVHMLRITTRDIFNVHKAEYFALDSNDIRLMKQLMDRAIKKEETLTSVMNSSGIDVIAPKGIF